MLRCTLAMQNVLQTLQTTQRNFHNNQTYKTIFVHSAYSHELIIFSHILAQAKSCTIGQTIHAFNTRNHQSKLSSVSKTAKTGAILPSRTWCKDFQLTDIRVISDGKLDDDVSEGW